MDNVVPHPSIWERRMAEIIRAEDEKRRWQNQLLDNLMQASTPPALRLVDSESDDAQEERSR